MSKVTVIGAGSWGTALACVLADNGYDVVIHSIEKELAEEITIKHTNVRYAPDILLPRNITSTTSYEEALQDTNLILVVVPSHVYRIVMKSIAPIINGWDKVVPLVSATKGIENESLTTMTKITKEYIAENWHEHISVLSGPTHAEEVVLRMPTTIVVANSNEENAKSVLEFFHNQYFRVYTNSDALGVELGGALKNVIALAAGISDGLGYGDNAKAALLTRGLQEMKRLGEALGGQSKTFNGLTGIGDLIVTGTSKHSRNWRTGNMLAKGIPLDNVLKEIGMVAEGVKTTESAYHLAKKANVEMPIVEMLHQILFENKNAEEATQTLMTRLARSEFDYRD